jgi:hypothetical protein
MRRGAAGRVTISGMGSSGILVFTWVAVGLVVAGYVWFIVWRVRAEKRKKAAEARAQQPMKDALRSPVLDTPLPVVPPPVTTTTGTQSAQAAASATVVTEPKAHATVIEALSGIHLPCDLVPLTTMAARPGVGDRIGFWTDGAPAETVGPAFAAELERLGYEVDATADARLHAHRAGTELVVVLHPDPLLATIADKPAFPSVPELAVVVEAWLPE